MSESYDNPPADTEQHTNPPETSATRRAIAWLRTYRTELAVAALVVAGTLTYLNVRALPWQSVEISGTVVTFDPVKLMNAQRAVAAKFMGQQDAGQAVELVRTGARTEAAIRKVAGPATLILVKQAVLVSTYPDITDQVLTELGLPTNVPTTDGIPYADADAVTSAGVTKNAEDVFTQLDKARARFNGRDPLVP